MVRYDRLPRAHPQACRVLRDAPSPSDRERLTRAAGGLARKAKSEEHQAPSIAETDRVLDDCRSGPPLRSDSSETGRRREVREETGMGGPNTGRNDPCPCGSGKKYEKCCLGRQEAPAASPVLAEALAELRQALEGKEFASEEEFQAFLQDFNAQRGRRPLDDFCGLSPEQLHRFLYFPFDSPQLVTFASRLDTPPAAPILSLFRLLAGAIGELGLKATATGNLPRKFVQEAASVFEPQGGYPKYLPGGIRSEEDFFDLHVTRLVAELSGLVKKTKGKFLLSRACRAELAKPGSGAFYPRLLLAYTRDFNWAYGDGYPSLPFLQQSFLYTLYLLDQFGDEWRPMAFYEDAFLRAFPAVLEEMEPVSYTTPENDLRSCYSLRCLERFAGFLGLIEIERESTRPFDRSFRLRRTPLLTEATDFRLTASVRGLPRPPSFGPCVPKGPSGPISVN